MPLDTELLRLKLGRLRDQLKTSLEEVSAATGIPVGTLVALESGQRQPTGDEVLILADYYKCDYRFLISNEQLTAYEQTERMFRKHGEQFSKEDRWAVQEFLFLCDCEEWALRELGRTAAQPFTAVIEGRFYKGHAERAASDLRRHLGYAPQEVPKDVYRDFRRLGLHVFRRRLGNSSISGLSVRHPLAGNCILVNYSEDVYRQRFTAAHEAAHALLDRQDFVVSFERWDPKDLSEIRAHTFAARYLLPPDFLARIPDPRSWSPDRVLEWAERLEVNPPTLAYALRDAGLVSERDAKRYQSVKVLASAKSDPELAGGLSPRSLERKNHLLSVGLSQSYVGLCFDAYDAGLVSAARVAEMMLASEGELAELAELFGRRPGRG